MKNRARSSVGSSTVHMSWTCASTSGKVSEPTDYRTVGNVKVAFTLYQAAAEQYVTMKFAKIENNVPVDDSVFVKK